MGLFGFESKKEREAREAKEYAERMAQIEAEKQAEKKKIQQQQNEKHELIASFIEKSPICIMMDDFEYGRPNEQFVNLLKGVSDAEVNNYLEQSENIFGKVVGLEIGGTFRGTITRVMGFGAWVQLTENREGLVHISKLSYQRVENINEVVHVGDKLWVEIIDIDNMGRISLSAINVGRIDKLCLEEYKQYTEQVNICLWYYAMKNPFSMDNFNRSASLNQKISQGQREANILIAEIYVAYQMNGTKIIQQKIKEYLHDDTSNKDHLGTVASALMWMKAYNEEKLVLEYMLNNNIPMNAKMQKRLQALSNHGGDAPESVNVESSTDVLYFDISALKWDDKDYQGFFENLSFQEKPLEYSLAVRDKNEMLTRGIGLAMPDDAKILERIQAVFEEEFGPSAYAKSMTCVAISNGNRENLNGILVQTTECEHLGILLCMVPIGKKLNIKFYTLYMPISGALEEQKQKVLSLRGELSPSASLWESSLKETILIAIQQLLNDTSTSRSSGSAASSSETVEF